MSGPIPTACVLTGGKIENAAVTLIAQNIIFGWIMAGRNDNIRQNKKTLSINLY